MRAPKKVIAAMAMATLLGSGAGQAFAATAVNSDSLTPVNYDFGTNTGSSEEDPSQKTQKYVENSNTDLSSLKSEGHIQINGTFDRKISSFPKPVKDGHYLRVSMPIELGYTYDLDEDLLVSAKGEVKNESVQVKTNADVTEETEKAVNMTFVKLENTNNDHNMKYINNKSEIRDDSNEIGLPFQVVISKNKSEFQSIPLASIEESEARQKENTIKIAGNTSLELKIARIGNQEIVNKDKLDDTTASIGSKMKMKFEYIGQE